VHIGRADVGIVRVVLVMPVRMLVAVLVCMIMMIVVIVMVIRGRAIRMMMILVE
jgi:hypothetical protein